MPVNVEIREAAPREAVAIARVINEAYQVEAFFKVGDRTNPREIADYLEAETFLVAVDAGDEVVAAVRVTIADRAGHLGMLAVADARKGTGLGRRLIEAAEAFAIERGCDSMDLEVASPRTELPNFYRKFGYELSGTSEWPEHARHELKQPANFLIMSKSLAAVRQREEVVGHQH